MNTVTNSTVPLLIESTDLALSLQPLLEAQRRAFEADRYPSLAVRRHRIDRLIELLLAQSEPLVEAMRLDYGHRSPIHSFLVDGPGLVAGMKDIRKNLAGWMRPERHSSGLAALFGARGRIDWQPLGVIGVIGAWNFPVALAVGPACQAFAAGNRVMVKLSEHTPRTAEVLREAMADRFDPTELVAITGDAQVGAVFSTLPFDHLFFTGGSKIGRHVLRAAADNLVPVTLELGGKSPAVVGVDADLNLAAQRIAVGKMLNAGQVCLAPDYALVPAGREEEFADCYRAAVTRMLPTLRSNDDYTAIINARHIARLRSYLDDARRLGAKIIEINPAAESFDGCGKIAPAVVLGATPAMKIMQEEVFGPLLPLVSYAGIDDVVRYINAGPRPLGAYYFGGNTSDLRYFLQQTHAGGVTINDVLHHAANENLPFGGVGESGMGSYHGIHGFRTFSHARAVQKAPRFSITFALKSPHGKRLRGMLKSMRERELKAVRKRLGQSAR